MPGPGLPPEGGLFPGGLFPDGGFPPDAGSCAPDIDGSGGTDGAAPDGAPDDGFSAPAAGGVGVGKVLRGSGASFCCGPGEVAPVPLAGTAGTAVSPVPDPGDIDEDEL
jgi:hypothetical protein